MNVKCKTCGSGDVVVACDRVMSPNENCVFLCLRCRASFMVSDATVQKERNFVKERACKLMLEITEKK